MRVVLVMCDDLKWSGALRVCDVFSVSVWEVSVRAKGKWEKRAALMNLRCAIMLWFINSL